MANESKPRAKQGLLASDHSKRGRRFVTVLDPSERRVTLLAPWEHAILVLCDGTRSASDIAALLHDGIEEEPITASGIADCLRFFEREGLIESVPKALPPAGPKTLANLQLAYREWHKDPEKSGRLLSGLLSPPFLDDPPPYRQSLAPTVALPDPNEEEDRPAAAGAPSATPVAVGSTLVVDGPAGANGRVLRSVLEDQAPVDISVSEEDLTNVAELLAAVDFDLAEDVDNLEAIVAPLSPTDLANALGDGGRGGGSVGRAMGGVADLPTSMPTPAAPMDAVRSVGPVPSGFDIAEPSEKSRSFRHRKVSEAALTPTLVGQAPPEGDGPPVILSPSPKSGSEDEAALGESKAGAAPAESKAGAQAKVSPGRAASKKKVPQKAQAGRDDSVGSAPRSAGNRVMATIGPEPSRPNQAAAPSIEDSVPARTASPAETPAE